MGIALESSEEVLNRGGIRESYRSDLALDSVRDSAQNFTKNPAQNSESSSSSSGDPFACELRTLPVRVGAPGVTKLLSLRRSFEADFAPVAPVKRTEVSVLRPQETQPLQSI